MTIPNNPRDTNTQILGEEKLREKLGFYQYPGTSQGIKLTSLHVDHIMQLLATEIQMARIDEVKKVEAESLSSDRSWKYLYRRLSELQSPPIKHKEAER